LIAALPEVLSAHLAIQADEVVEASEVELKKASLLVTAPQVLGVFYQPDISIDTIQPEKKLYLALDGIQDPGNMGTIVRIADWFGIDHLICSIDTVDLFNPKTVQATMGAIARVRVSYTNLAPFLQKQKHLPLYGTFLDGENIYADSLSSN